MIFAVLGLSGLAIFSKGFFPSKSVIGGHAELTTSDAFATDSGDAQFEKLIFVIVDAMRSDFMFSNESRMLFLHELIHSGNALPFTAHSNPPTVTLPRLKGITTGQIPSFVDAILNIADDNDGSQALTNTDSWVGQFRRQSQDRKMSFFGDDTWLKLFPAEHFFNQSEGTSLFFVNDFTEVDRNVSRHIESQLDEGFDALILHYLGLDHIGHAGGPKSVHMEAKQHEMDGILKLLYESIHTDDKTLIVFMGDHGMNEIGNHGGSSKGETSPGLVLASPKFKELGIKTPISTKQHDDFEYHTLIDQIDIVPTLAALFNFPIPKNSVGVMISNILQCWLDEAQKKRILLENSEQMFALISALLPSDAIKFEQSIESLRNIDHSRIEDYWRLLQALKEVMVRNSTNYSVVSMYCGLVISVALAVVLLYRTFFQIRQSNSAKPVHTAFFVCLLVAYAAHFHGSSLIEEEHQFWWFFTVLALSTQIITCRFTWKSAAICFSCVRLIRAWSSMGQKFRLAKTASEILLDTPNVLWPLVCITVYTIPVFNSKITTCSGFQSIITLLFEISMGSLTVILKLLQSRIDGVELPSLLEKKLAFFGENADPLMSMRSSAVLTSRIFFALFLVCWLLRAYEKGPKRFTKQSILLLQLFLHESRVENIPLYLVFGVLEQQFMSQLQSNDMFLGVTTLCIQNLAFFSIGNTNLIATIDLSNAYNGIEKYNLILVGVLTFISNFAPALHWGLAWFRLSENFGKPHTRECLKERYAIGLTFYAVAQASLLASCIIQRYHLFIWSVFCPKVLYFAAWFVLVEIGFGLIVCRTLMSAFS